MKLNLGVARGIITPKVGCMLYGYSSQPHSTGVHDDLTVTVYAFSYGEKKLLYINATLCVFRNDIAKELREMISEKFGYDFENIVLGTTHTHSGPSVAGMSAAWGGFDFEYYEEILKPVLFSTVGEALENIEPVTMATAFGNSDIGVNRRMWKDGTNKMWLGECPWGILNTKMTILSFKAEDGTVKGNLVCYGAHGTSAGASTLITRDWSGYMVDALEEKTGGLTAFVLGPEGDVGPRKLIGGDSRMEETEALGEYSAKEVIRIFESLGEYKDVSLDTKNCKIKIKLLPRMSREDAIAKMEELKKGVMYNMETVQYEHCEATVKSYDEGYIEREYDEFEQVVFRIGDVAFSTFAFEIFGEIGLRIEYEIKDLNVVNMVCTNGQMGYFPTQSQIALGGYEITMFKNHGIQVYSDDADYSAIVSTVENINSLER
ncbi:MAG: neutral/alkaline non-lysosomal ceramidase N-terminal domain-containing protein [Clostridia bacterium]|nr:neutral/alkaline non-lysosomal ceramidase N-terminal domain-containing protein [Clostridia bacterium]